jgi:hypothetical protein
MIEIGHHNGQIGRLRLLRIGRHGQQQSERACSLVRELTETCHDDGSREC